MSRPPFRLYEGGSAPRPNQTPMAPSVDVSSGMTGIARALGRVGQGFERAADTVLDVERIEYQRRQDDARVLVAQRMAEARRESNELRRRAQEQAENGWQGLTETVAQGWTELRQRYMSEPGMTPEAQTFLSQALDLYEPELLDNAASDETTGRRQWRVDTGNEATDTLSSVINADPSQYDAVLAQHLELITGLSDITDDQRRGLEARAREQFALSAVAGMVERDPRSTLALLRDPNAQGPFSELTGQQRDAYANRAQAELNRRQTEARAAQAQFVASLRDTVTAQRDLFRRGVMPSDPVDVSVVARYLGPDVAQAFMGDMAGVAAQRAVAPLSMGEVARLAAGAQSPENSDLQNMGVAIVSEQAARSLTQRREDPGEFAIQNRLMRTPENGLMGTIGEALQTGDWDGFQQVMRARSADALELRRTGVVDRVAPLSRNEARALSTWLGGLTEQARLGFFSQALANMQPEAYQAMLAQIAPEGSAVVAYAGARFADNELVARRLLRGVEVLNGGPQGQDGQSQRRPLVEMPSDDDLRAVFEREVRDAYRGMPNSVGPTWEAFRAYYAAASEAAGDTATDSVDLARAREAVGAATGGLITWSGRRTVMPPGMRARDWESSVAAAFRGRAELSSLDPSQYILTATGGGQYIVEGVRDAQGNPVVVRVTR